jgi:putative FmdB family regulatory protein
MPVYEFTCRACGHEFEQLVLQGREAPACPECHGTDLERMLSMFAVTSDAMRHRSLQLARRKARSSTDRVDKNVADQEYVRNHYAEEGVDVTKGPQDSKKKK